MGGSEIWHTCLEQQNASQACQQCYAHLISEGVVIRSTLFYPFQDKLEKH